MSEPKVKIEALPERPTHLWISEKIATMTSPSGEVIQIDRAATNPFVFLMRGEKMEAEIDLTDFMKEVARQVMQPSVPALDVDVDAPTGT